VAAGPLGPKAEKEEELCPLFSFLKHIFQMDFFEFSLEIESTTQYKKIQWNSMNAHSCNYTL
jgi:hypothetical protein